MREKLKHFVSKDALNIEGLGKKLIDNFWNKKLIKYPFDIFNLNLNFLINLDGWGQKSISNLKNSINKSKNISLDRFIFSLGIRHIGQENAKVLAKHFLSVRQFFETSAANRAPHNSIDTSISKISRNGDIRSCFLLWSTTA